MSLQSLLDAVSFLNVLSFLFVINYQVYKVMVGPFDMIV